MFSAILGNIDYICVILRSSFKILQAFIIWISANHFSVCLAVNVSLHSRHNKKALSQSTAGQKGPLLFLFTCVLSLFVARGLEYIMFITGYDFTPLAASSD